MIIDRLDLKAATTLLGNQTKSHYGWLTFCEETGLQMMTGKSDARIPTWVAINEHDRMTKSMWIDNGETKFEFKQLKRTINNTYYRELDIELLNERETKIVSNNQTFITECIGIPENMLRITGELRGKALGHTNLSGNLYQAFKAMRLSRWIDFGPVNIEWGLDWCPDLFVLSKRKLDENDDVIESINATCDAETPLQEITAKVVGYDFIESLGRIGKAMWAKGSVEITLYERMMEFYLVTQRKPSSSKIHFRTIIPLELTGNRS
tara:strand:- start:37641 stop:38435 length:795 start_codon:yes stop_codon:yes gene_type:complete